MFANSQFRYFGRFLTSLHSVHQHPICVWKLSIPHQPLFQAHKTRSFVHFKGCGSATYIFVYVCQYLHISKHPSLIHQSLTTGVNSSLRACGHVGCCVEFHPASLSEGCGWGYYTFCHIRYSQAQGWCTVTFVTMFHYNDITLIQPPRAAYMRQ